MRFITVAILLLLSCSFGSAAEIKLNYARPSRMLGMIAMASPTAMIHEWNATGDNQNQNLIPAGIARIRADDRKRVLLVDGDPDALEELQRYVSLFDVKARDVKFTVDVEDPLDQHRARSETTIRNNKQWSMEDGITSYEIKIAARINDDNTVSTYITLKKQGVERSIVVRVKNGNTIEIAPEQLLGAPADQVKQLVQMVNNKAVVGKFDPHTAKITIRPTIID